MSERFIPNEKLLDGFLKGIEHIDQLLKSCVKLNESKNYSISIAMSVLAFEELTKLRLIETRLRGNKPIKKQEWISITKGGSHTLKQVKMLDDSMQEVVKMGEGHHKKVQELDKKLGHPIPPSIPEMLKEYEKWKHKMKNLNKIKQDCLYLNWKNSGWSTFAQEYSLKEQEALSEVLFVQNHLLLFDLILEYKFPSVPLNEKSIKFQQYRDDPIRKKQVEIHKKSQSNDFKKKISVAKSIIENYS